MLFELRTEVKIHVIGLRSERELNKPQYTRQEKTERSERKVIKSTVELAPFRCRFGALKCESLADKPDFGKSFAMYGGGTLRPPQSQARYGQMCVSFLPFLK